MRQQLGYLMSHIESKFETQRSYPPLFPLCFALSMHIHSTDIVLKQHQQILLAQ
jgi:hypothetical protein